jgi:hypothetical protein
MIVLCTQPPSPAAAGSAEAVASELQQVQAAHDKVARLGKGQLTIYAAVPDEASSLPSGRQLLGVGADVGTCGQLCQVRTWRLQAAAMYRCPGPAVGASIPRQPALQSVACSSPFSIGRLQAWHCMQLAGLELATSRPDTASTQQGRQHLTEQRSNCNMTCGSNPPLPFRADTSQVVGGYPGSIYPGHRSILRWAACAVVLPALHRIKTIFVCHVVLCCLARWLPTVAAPPCASVVHRTVIAASPQAVAAPHVGSHGDGLQCASS